MKKIRAVGNIYAPTAWIYLDREKWMCNFTNFLLGFVFVILDSFPSCGYLWYLLLRMFVSSWLCFSTWVITAFSSCFHCIHRDQKILMKLFLCTKAEKRPPDHGLWCLLAKVVTGWAATALERAEGWNEPRRTPAHDAGTAGPLCW